MYKTPAQNGITNGHSTPTKIVAFGNPLLDISVELEDDSLLREFKLKPDDQQELPMDDLMQIIATLMERKHSLHYNPGGSALNTCRILKLLQENVLFCGGIGNDANGVILEKILSDNGVTTCLQRNDDIHTGTCICLIFNDKRSLNANIGAALFFDHNHLETVEKLTEINAAESPLEQQEGIIFYIEGYFIPEKLDVCKYINEKYCEAESPNLFVTNLNAPYIIRKFPEGMKYLVESADIVFGNTKEFLALQEIYRMESLTLLIKYLISNHTKDRDKILIITNSNKPVHLHYGKDDKICSEEISPESIPLEKIQDTTGAGDSFVSGFLHMYLKKQNLIDCVKCGCSLSGQIIQKIGCNL